MNLVRIDGSYGEGGGSIFRYALALSAVSLKPVEVYNIRAKRSKPGLRPQHLSAARLLAEITSATVEGLEVGSTRVRFIPRERRGGRYRLNVGTAGSVSLVIQALLPAALFADSTVQVELIGGTDVPMAPPIDYMRYVFARNLSLMGANVEIDLERRGHYPRGGGKVRLTVHPLNSLAPLNVTGRGEVRKIEGIAHAVKLPRHVAERIRSAALERLRESGLNASIELDWSPNSHLGPGAGIALWAECKAGVSLGGDSLGKRGKPSEVVGREAAERLLKELRVGAAFDRHTGDMIIPYLALASGESKITVTEYTSHAKSNVWLVRTLLGVELTVQRSGNGWMIRGKGVGLS